VNGKLTLACAHVAGRSRLTTLRGEGLMRASRPLRDDGDAVRVVTATLGPGLLGGDCVDRDVDVASGATLILAAQMATPVFAGVRCSRSISRSRVASGAALYSAGEVLLLGPLSTHEAFAEVDVSGDGLVLTAEIALLGTGARLRSRTSARIGGRLVARDACDLDGDGDGAQRPLLTAMIVTSQSARLDALAEAIGSELAHEPDARGGLGGTERCALFRARADGVWPLQRLLDRIVALTRASGAQGTAAHRVGAVAAL